MSITPECREELHKRVKWAFAYDRRKIQVTAIELAALLDYADEVERLRTALKEES